jgi:hypothetical protein
MLAEKSVKRGYKPQISASFIVFLGMNNEAGQKFEAQGPLQNISDPGFSLCTGKYISAVVIDLYRFV